jgi:hypothetical protein
MPQITRKNQFVSFYGASPVGDQTGGKKLADLLSLWQPVVKLFFEGADRIQLKSGVGIPEMNQKDEPRTRYYIHLQSRATGKKIFTSRARCC